MSFLLPGRCLCPRQGLWMGWIRMGTIAASITRLSCPSVAWQGDDPNGNAVWGDKDALGWSGLSTIVFLDSDRDHKKAFSHGISFFLKMSYPLLVCSSSLSFCSPFLIIKFSQRLSQQCLLISCLLSPVSSPPKEPALGRVRTESVDNSAMRLARLE